MDKGKIFSLLDEHFGKDMMMDCIENYRESECHYMDSHIYMIFIYGMTEYSGTWIRILINKKSENLNAADSFSKNVSIEAELDKESLVSLIRESVKTHAGWKSRNFLEDWYESKKSEIRDKRISDLGL